MAEALTIWTYDWVPEGTPPRGHVRDIRLRWACEEAGLEWTIAALNSIEMVTVPWWFIGLSNTTNNPLEGWMLQRLKHLEAVLVKREWLAAGQFTVADILMADALRVPRVRAASDFPALRSYVERACARPAFKRAYDGQMAHFAAGDKLRGKA
jgi:glutathione S-transferase